MTCEQAEQEPTEKLSGLVINSIFQARELNLLRFKYQLPRELYVPGEAISFLRAYADSSAD